MVKLETIGFEQAKRLAEKTIEVAIGEGVEIAVSVIDITGKRLVSFTMDGVIPIAPELSEKKARLALKMNLDTIELQKQGVNVMDFGSGYSAFGGGKVIQMTFKRGRAHLPQVETKIIGAIGVSGLDAGQADHDLATEGLKDTFGAPRLKGV